MMEYLFRLHMLEVLHIVSDNETRFSRIQQRSRPGDPQTIDAMLSFEMKEYGDNSELSMK